MTGEIHRIDVHQHILPAEYLSALAKLAITPGGGNPLPTWEAWDVQSTLELMDRQGIATAITSIPEPGIYFGDSVVTRDLARRCNDYCARLIHEYPHRFGAFAILPL